MNDPANPFAAPDHGLDRHQVTKQGPGQSYAYMGFWMRVVAMIIDSVVQFLMLLPVGLLLGHLIESEQAVELTGNIIELIAGVIFVLVFWSFKSATPGKMVLGMRIVDAKTLRKPTFGQFVTRYIGYIPSTLALGLGFLWVAWDPRKQGWHDKMANTLVVRLRSGSERRSSTRRVTPARRAPAATPAAAVTSETNA